MLLHLGALPKHRIPPPLLYRTARIRSAFLPSAHPSIRPSYCCKVGLLAETLLEAATQDNAFTGGEVSRLRRETRAFKSKLAQARRERALKAMGVGPTSASSPSGAVTALPVLGAGAGSEVCVFACVCVFFFLSCGRIGLVLAGVCVFLSWGYIGLFVGR